MKDNFSKQAGGYARYRPTYPAELFDFIFQSVPVKEKAWDCATGNGQTARELSPVFQHVFATDISQQQLDHAWSAPNITYSLQPAEKTNFANDSFNLITVSQALHWFSFDEFYQEATRAGKDQSLLAIWTYSLLTISPPIDKLLLEHHYDTLGPYWDSERRYVDEDYKTIPFPFRELPTPPFFIRNQWSLQDLDGYFHTSSALQKYMAARPDDPIPELLTRIREHWKGEKMDILFPIHLRLGIIEKKRSAR